MKTDVLGILQAVLDEYSLPWNGYHGVGHWARVLENGLFLAGETNADIEVVRLFALLHDSRRVNEGTDPDHGPRARRVREDAPGPVLRPDRRQVQLLHRACAGHTHERTHPDITIQACWDADRLDLGRVGITPDPAWLCTDVARRPETIREAHGRSTFHVVPSFVLDDWGIDLD